MLDGLDAGISQAHLETESVSAFLACTKTGYQSAILERNLDILVRVKSALTALVSERGELDILVPESDKVVYIPKMHLDTALQEELNFMLAVSRATSGHGIKRLQIKQAFFRPTHPHRFSVINSNWNSRGTKIETASTSKIAGEGDLAFIGGGVLHSSHADLRTNKVTVAIFNA